MHELFSNRAFLMLWQDNAQKVRLSRGCYPPRADFPRPARGDVQGDLILR